MAPATFILYNKKEDFLIERYCNDEISSIWSDKNKFRLHSIIEIMHLSVMLNLEESDAILLCRKYCNITDDDILNIRLIEAQTKHETVAFIKHLSNKIEKINNNDLSEPCIKNNWIPKIHYGLTSSDLLDNTMSIQVLSSIIKISLYTEDLISSLEKHTKYTSNIMGRTHGKFAEEIPLNKIFHIHINECKRFLDRLMHARVHTKIRGPVGEYTNITRAQELMVISRIFSFLSEDGKIDNKDSLLSIVETPEFVNQAVSRTEISRIISEFSIFASELERFTTNIRLYSRSDCGEMSEGFASGQYGSSAMPHKINPIKCENIAGIARILRGFSIPSMENIILWHERDMSHSSSERIILPDSFHLIAHILVTNKYVVDNLYINIEKIMETISLHIEEISSQKKMLKLIDAGESRFDAYEKAKSLTK